MGTSYRFQVSGFRFQVSGFKSDGRFQSLRRVVTADGALSILIDLMALRAKLIHLIVARVGKKATGQISDFRPQISVVAERVDGGDGLRTQPLPSGSGKLAWQPAASSDLPCTSLGVPKARHSPCRSYSGDGGGN
jgi:hypothetical protein